MKNHEALEKLVIDAVVAATNVPASKIKIESWLMGDLELESIDFLELNFELERNSGREINFLKIIDAAQRKTSSVKRDMRISDIIDYLANDKNG